MSVGNLYSGDDVSAIVLDIGQHTTKLGYAGETVPSTVLPTVAAIQDISGTVSNTIGGQQKSTRKCSFDPTEFNFPKNGVEVKNFLHDGIVEDYDLFEQLLNQSYARYLMTDPSQHPLLLTEPVWNTKNSRESVAEVLFEKYKIPALYFAKNSMLSAFTLGLSNALVLDSGAHHTTVSVVYSGKVLQNVVIRTPYGGDCITEICRRMLAEKNVDIIPHFMVKSKEKVGPGEPSKWVKKTGLAGNLHHSWINHMITEEIRDYKETVLKVLYTKYDIDKAKTKSEEINYEFADGFNLNCSLEDQYFIPEIFFDTNFKHANSKAYLNGSKGSNQQILPPSISYADLVWKCISNCDIDMRHIMLKSIVLSGGNTLFEGFTDRFVNDLNVIAENKNCKFKVFENEERINAPWIGGSILASCGSFQQLWISHYDFAEKGKACVDPECY